mmetsp:Transcript_19438/g.19738  ORF Transcript_19438/g.19738 Transcript_19438/m.19738 type:complete len:82 (-) Transcript_19438:12-257(-)
MIRTWPISRMFMILGLPKLNVLSTIPKMFQQDVVLETKDFVIEIQDIIDIEKGGILNYQNDVNFKNQIIVEKKTIIFNLNL